MRAIRWLVADWQGNKGDVFEGVMASLTTLGHSIEIIPRSDMARRDEFVAAIRGGRFDALLTWQRFYPMHVDILSAIAESGIRTLFMDYGFWPHYYSVVFDPKGENAESSLVDLWKSGEPPHLDQGDLDRAEALIEDEASRATNLGQPDIPELRGIRRPFVFVPLQRPQDAVILYDSSVHRFDELVRRVLDMAAGQLYVVFKTHPLDRDIELGLTDEVGPDHSVIRQAYGRKNEDICDYLLSRADVVVAVNSNMLFRAVLFGTPAIAVGKGWFTGSGAVTEVEGIGGLQSLSASPVSFATRQRYVGACLSRQLPFNRLSDPDQMLGILHRIGFGDILGPLL